MWVEVLYTRNHKGNYISFFVAAICSFVLLALAGVFVHDAVASTNPNTTSKLTITSQDIYGNIITGYYTELYANNGTQIDVGFTPYNFTLNKNQTYTVHVEDYKKYMFSYWLDTGSINANRTVSITSNTTITAVYKTVPQPPTRLNATMNSQSQFNLSWNTPSDDGGSPITGYGVQRSTDGGLTWNILVKNTGDTYTTYFDTGTQSNTTYSYRVFSLNSVGSSSASNTIFATTGTRTSPSLTLLFLVRNGFPDEQNLISLYQKHARSADIVAGFSNTLLDSNVTSQIPGQKAITYFSLANIQANAIKLHNLGYQWIVYDLEPGLSPANEVADPIASVQNASQYVHSTGLKLVMSPAGISSNNYSSMAKYSDGWILQVMDAIAGNPTTMSNTIHGNVAKIKSGNPNEIVVLQGSINKDTVDQMNNAWDLTKDVVNGMTVFYSTPSQLPQMAQVFTHIDGIS